MTSAEIVNAATPIVVAAIGAAVTAFLNSATVKGWINAHADKLAAEAASLVTEYDAKNNIFVRVLVKEAMAYAETKALPAGKSKADFVIQRVSADPRFSALCVPLSALELIVEDLFLEFFKDFDKAVTK